MSNIKISELIEATEANENDLLMIIQNGENKKIKASKVGTGQAGGGDTLPIGAILPFSSDTVPNGWLLCDGSSFSVTSYPELFDVIGTTYGYDDDRNPKLPDLRGRVAVGKKDATSADDTEFTELGKIGGEKTHTLTVDEMPSHTHNASTKANWTGSSSTWAELARAPATSGDIEEKDGYISATGGDQPHNNLQPYIVTNFIIKAKNTVVIKGEIIQEDGTASETNVYSSVAMDNKLKTNIVTGQEVATNEYIDGKQIFVKRINLGTLPNATEKSIATDLKVSEVTLYKFEGLATGSNSNGSYCLSLPDINPNGPEQATRVTFESSNDLWQIKIRTGIDRTNYTAEINIYYTKN